MQKTVKRGTLVGVLVPPSDKSISHRTLILSALAEGVSRVSNLLSSQDVRSTQACLQDLGVRIVQEDGSLKVEGLGGGFHPPSRPLQCGNSGTTMRLLAGTLAGQAFSSVLVGDASLSRRPMQRIIRPLRMMGASAYSSPAGSAPVIIQGGSLRGIEYSLPVASAQLKSAILLASVQANGRTMIYEPRLSRDHTEIMLQRMGIEVLRDDYCISVVGPQVLQATDYRVPGDISSAAPFIVAAAITQGSHLRVRDVGLNPTRTGIIHVLKRMGASIELFESGFIGSGHEPAGDIVVKAAALSGVEVSAAEIPLMIDEIPLLVVAACMAKGKTVIRGAGELRHKESDRIEGIVRPLLAMGARIQVEGDDIAVWGPSRLSGHAADSLCDHRLAMALAVAGLNADGPVTILQSEWVGISFPAFWQEFERLQEGRA